MNAAFGGNGHDADDLLSDSLKYLHKQFLDAADKYPDIRHAGVGNATSYPEWPLIPFDDGFHLGFTSNHWRQVLNRRTRAVFFPLSDHWFPLDGSYWEGAFYFDGDYVPDGEELRKQHDYLMKGVREFERLADEASAEFGLLRETEFPESVVEMSPPLWGAWIKAVYEQTDLLDEIPNNEMDVFVLRGNVFRASARAIRNLAAKRNALGKQTAPLEIRPRPGATNQKQILRDRILPELQKLSPSKLHVVMLHHNDQLSVNELIAGCHWLDDTSSHWFGGLYGESTENPELRNYFAWSDAPDVRQAFGEIAADAGRCLGEWALSYSVNSQSLAERYGCNRWMHALFDMAVGIDDFPMEAKVSRFAETGISEMKLKLRYNDMSVSEREELQRVIAERQSIGYYAYLRDAVKASVYAIDVLAGVRSDSTKGGNDDVSTERGPVIEELERTTPELKVESVEWVAARKENEEKLGLPTDTLRNYRAPSKGGRKMPDEMFGVDRDGRRWRRKGTPKSRVYYFVPSLPKR